MRKLLIVLACRLAAASLAVLQTGEATADTVTRPSVVVIPVDDM